jgi:ketosteroid isomerase-like protein
MTPRCRLTSGRPVVILIAAQETSRMKYLTLTTFVCLAMVSSAGAQTGVDPQLVAPINKFMDAFNKGDIAGAAATHAAEADLAILDEVPPFLWRGPKAFQAWAGDLDKESKKLGITDQKVTVSAPTRVESDGTAAYVVVPAVYAFKMKGEAMRESAQMTFVLKKGASGWLIHGWTWTGPKPAVKAAAPAKK